MQRTERRSRLSWILKGIFILLSISCALVLVVSYFSSSVDPRDNSWIAVLGLGQHVLIFLNIVWLFVWLLLRRVWFFVPLVSLLVGLGHIGSYYQVHFTKEYASQDRSKLDTLTLASYNVAKFHYPLDSARRSMVVDSISSYFASAKVDVIFMQEYWDMPNDSISLYQDDFSGFPYSDFMSSPGARGLSSGLVIKSRYPLRNVHYYRFKGTQNSFMSADLVRERGDTITLFNCHLQSTEFNTTQPDGLTALVEREDREEAMGRVNEKLGQNFSKRAYQADSLRYVIDSLGGRVIVGGDFNDTPNSWALSTTRGEDLLDSFCEAGAGFGYSYRPMKRLFRIDYFLYKAGCFDALEYTSTELPWSDHNPVVVKFVVNDLNQSKKE